MNKVSINENLKESFLNENNNMIIDNEIQDIVIDSDISRDFSELKENDLKNQSAIPQINLSQELRFISKPYVDIRGNEVNLYITFSLNDNYFLFF